MKFAIEIKKSDRTWVRWGGETFEFKTNAELQALTLQEQFCSITRVVPIPEPIITPERW